MRLIDRLRAVAPAEQVASQSVLSSMWPDADRERIQPMTSYADAGFKSNAIIYSLVNARANLFAQAEFKFQSLTTRRLFGTPGLALLEQPWPNGTTGDLLARMLQDVDLAGNAFVRLTPFGTLQRLRPDWVEIMQAERYADDGTEAYEVIGYGYRSDGTAVDEVYPVEEVAHWAPVPDPTARWRGMSWITPIVREVNADISMTAHRQAFFDNAATPNLMIRYSQRLNQETVDRIRERWNARYSGAASAGGTVILDEGADLTVVGKDMRETSFDAVQAAGEARMASAAGVPPIVAGLRAGLAAATYSNYEQALKAFANNTMAYLWQSAVASLGKLVPVPAGSRLWYDTGTIPALQDAETARAEAAHTYAQAASVLITAGYEPTSVQDALIAGDMALLAHSGLVSVQLQQPGALPVAPGGAAA